MKTSLLKRVERIESRAWPCEGITAIFRLIVEPGLIQRPVKGWSFGNGADRVEVLRGEGENDDDLKQRAVAQAREQLGKGIHRFMSL